MHQQWRCIMATSHRTHAKAVCYHDYDMMRLSTAAQTCSTHHALITLFHVRFRQAHAHPQHLRQ